MKTRVLYVVSMALLAMASLQVAHKNLVSEQRIAFQPGVGKCMEGPVPWPGKKAPVPISPDKRSPKAIA